MTSVGGGRTGLVLRWSGRDLRARWVQVAVIAAIIALGSGFYSGLSSTSAWRIDSYDASYAATRPPDLRLTLSTGNFLPADTLRAVASGPRQAGQIVAASPRLTGPVQVDASPSAAETVIVPGLVTGIDLSGADGKVSLPTAITGRNLEPGDDGADVVLLGPQMARFYDLPPGGELELSGGRRVRYVGQGFVPEGFVVVGQSGHEASAADYATLVTSLSTAQDLLGQPGQANELAVRVAEGADAAAVQRQVDLALDSAAPGVGRSWSTQEEDPGRRLLYDGVENGQRLYTIFALLLLAGAAFGAFNLTVRIVESQRREIGVAMALGTPTGRIAVRPLLLGLEVALLGAVLGVGVGLLLAELFGAVFRDVLPLPVWVTGFQPAVFARGLALGVTVPMVAAALPVWRAVRVTPIEAIRTTATSAGGVGRPLLGRLRLPGSSVARMPVRNVVRAPRRSLLTALGIAATVTVLVALLGLVDSFFATIDSAKQVIADEDGRRAQVSLDRFHLVDEPDVTGIRTSPVVAESTADVQVVGTLRHRDSSVDAVLQLSDLRRGLWSPPLTAGAVTGDRPGVVLPTRAATDLGVEPGDTVTLRHPLRTGATSYTFTESPVEVLGVTPLPLRFLVFMDSSSLDLMGLEGTTNVVTVNRAEGVGRDEFTRTLYGLPGVGSVSSPTTTVRAVTAQLDEILGILRIVDAALVLMAALIAFNSTSINLEERAREQATMLAFGLPLRSVMGVAVAESLITGVAGTLAGIAAGRVVLHWIVTRMLPDVVPDLGVVDHLGWTTVALALALGVLAVGVAPLFSVRRLSRMDVPATLRVME